MKKYSKEIVLWAIMILPYAYLAIIWNELSDQVPVHFNIKGEADNWSSKTALLVFPAIMGIGIYLVMLIIPKIDPKKKIEQMGDKYYTLRVVLTAFFSVFAIYSIYLGKEGSLQNPNMMLALVGIMFAVLGNYLQTMRPNYFIGIRTPWTLENEEVWKKTHQVGGPLFMIAGILIAILSFIIHQPVALAVSTGIIIFGLIIFLLVYSYREYQKIKTISHMDKP